jgi:hypothetical protein
MLPRKYFKFLSTFRNENTGKIEVGLAEEIYENQENTDSLKNL